jgi:hypothetical protein
MKAGNIVLCVLINLTVVQELESNNEKRSNIQDLYKNIGDQLVSIREQFPESQPKIYAVLDQIGKLYSLAKNKREEVHHIKELIKTRDLENIALQNEVITLKSELDITQMKIDETSRTLAQERARSFKLAEEKQKLVVEKEKETQELLRTAQEVQLSEDVKKELLEEPKEIQQPNAKIELKPIEIREKRQKVKSNLFSKLKNTLKPRAAA